MVSWKGRGNLYFQFVRVLYCKLPTNSKQLPAFLLEAVSGTECRPQRWEARVLPLCYRGPPLSDVVQEYTALGICAEGSLSLHNGSAMRQLPMIKSCKLNQFINSII